MALVRTDQSSNPPAYDEDADFNKALALSMDDQGPPPLEPIPHDSDLPVYGPVQDPSKGDNRVSVLHALLVQNSYMWSRHWIAVQTTHYEERWRRALMMGGTVWRQMYTLNPRLRSRLE